VSDIQQFTRKSWSYFNSTRFSFLKSDIIFCVGDLPSMTHTAFGCRGTEEGKKERKEKKDI